MKTVILLEDMHLIGESIKDFFEMKKYRVIWFDSSLIKKEEMKESMKDVQGEVFVISDYNDGSEGTFVRSLLSVVEILRDKGIEPKVVLNSAMENHNFEAELLSIKENNLNIVGMEMNKRARNILNMFEGNDGELRIAR